MGTQWVRTNHPGSNQRLIVPRSNALQLSYISLSVRVWGDDVTWTKKKTQKTQTNPTTKNNNSTDTFSDVFVLFYLFNFYNNLSFRYLFQGQRSNDNTFENVPLRREKITLETYTSTLRLVFAAYLCEIVYKTYLAGNGTPKKTPQKTTTRK